MSVPLFDQARRCLAARHLRGLLATDVIGALIRDVSDPHALDLLGKLCLVELEADCSSREVEPLGSVAACVSYPAKVRT